MTPIYCPHCNRFLCKARVAEIEIKCPKCKQVVMVRFAEATRDLFAPLTESCKIITIKKTG